MLRTAFIFAMLIPFCARAFVPEYHLGFERRATRYAISSKYAEEMDESVQANGLFAGVRFKSGVALSLWAHFKSDVIFSGAGVGEVAKFSAGPAYGASAIYFFGGIHGFEAFAGTELGRIKYNIEIAGVGGDTELDKNALTVGAFAGVDYNGLAPVAVRAVMGRRGYSGRVLAGGGFYSLGLICKF